MARFRALATLSSLILVGAPLVALPIPTANAQPAPAAPGTPAAAAALIRPGIIKIAFSVRDGQPDQSILDLVLIPAEGEAVGFRQNIQADRFGALLKRLYSQVTRQEDLNVSNPRSPSRELYQLLFAELALELDRRGINTLLISLDRGLQALPLAALHDGNGFLGQRYGFAITPSINLTELATVHQGSIQLLAAGASRFDGLAPLPLVPEELASLKREVTTDAYLDSAFTPDLLISKSADNNYSNLHIASHADFRPGGPKASQLYTGTVPMGMDQFARIRSERQSQRFDLVSLSACRTSVGDELAELGFAGLALQTGARSAIGTLWYVDDVATSAYFVLLYHYLAKGVPKAQAIQLVQRAFANGEIRIQDTTVVGPNGLTLVGNLSPSQASRYARFGFSHPFFWSGMILSGSPW